MILLQVTNELQNHSHNDFFYYLEILIVIIVIVLQVIHSLKLYGSVKRLRTVFDERITIINGYVEKDRIGESDNILSEIKFGAVENKFIENSDRNIVKLPLVQSKGDNEVISRIIETLNLYLVNNYGAAVNFSIIKDIIDREVDVNDEDISQSIPTPLYLGLAATMIGIIFGLLAMPKLNGDGFAEGINALINGVKLAMTASLSGLLCTTLLSSLFYKRAKRIVLRDKNEQLSYLQAKLLPELVRAEDTGVSGLKASLDRFAREATKISDNVRIAASQTGSNLQAQLDVISKVENLNMTRISKVNLELFDRLETNMVAFNQFSNYLALMNKISDNLVSFSNRTEHVEVIASEIKSTLYDSRELSKFLTAHFQQIENAGAGALQAVDLSDSHFREAIGKLTAETNTRISALNNLSDTTETTLKEVFDSIGEKLNEITETHLNSLRIAYNESIPHFDELDNLKVLPELNDKSSSQSKELVDAINQLNRSINSIGNRIDNQSVLDKLVAIEAQLKRRSSSGSRKVKAESEPKRGFFNRLFKRKSKVSKDEEEEEREQ